MNFTVMFLLIENYFILYFNSIHLFFLFHSVLFYSLIILFYFFILRYIIIFYSILLLFIILYYIILYYILVYSFLSLFHSTPFFNFSFFSFLQLWIQSENFLKIISQSYPYEHFFCFFLKIRNETYSRTTPNYHLLK